jgi:hypothetical protein
MRLLLTAFLFLALPGTAAAAAQLSLGLETSSSVQYGSAHEMSGRLTDDGAPLAGLAVDIEVRAYPFHGGFRRAATLTTASDGTFTFKRSFERNTQVRAVSPALGDPSPTVQAYVFPRPSSTFKALDGGRRLRITQILRTPRGVRLTAKTIFYLGPKTAKSAPAVASARPVLVAPGSFRAPAAVPLPAWWKGAFRYGSCFRYSPSSGLGDPGVTCPRRYRF